MKSKILLLFLISILFPVAFASVLLKRQNYGPGDVCYYGHVSSDGRAPCYPNCGCTGGSYCQCYNDTCTCRYDGNGNGGGGGGYYRPGDVCYYGHNSTNGRAPCYPNCGCTGGSYCQCHNGTCTCKYGGSVSGSGSSNYGPGDVCYYGQDPSDGRAPCYPNCGCSSGYSCQCHHGSCTCRHYGSGSGDGSGHHGSGSGDGIYNPDEICYHEHGPTTTDYAPCYPYCGCKYGHHCKCHDGSCTCQYDGHDK